MENTGEQQFSGHAKDFQLFGLWLAIPKPSFFFLVVVMYSVWSVPNICFALRQNASKSFFQKLSNFVTFFLVNSRWAFILTFLRSGFPLATLPQRQDLWRTNDIVDVYTGSSISTCELCNSVTVVAVVSFLPVQSIWMDGLILVVFALDHIPPVKINFTVPLGRSKPMFVFRCPHLKTRRLFF